MANQLTVVSGQKRNQTMITFSNGAQWDRIAAPKYVDGKRIRCHLVRQILQHTYKVLLLNYCMNLVR